MDAITEAYDGDVQMIDFIIGSCPTNTPGVLKRGWNSFVWAAAEAD